MPDTRWTRRSLGGLGLLAFRFVLVGSLGLLVSEAGAIVHGETASSGPVGGSSTAAEAMAVGVDEGSGAAVLSIPIDLPPGPNGLVPELSFSYSSAAGNGLLGVGWRLRLPRVECSARFGVPDRSDCLHFELDGQLLVGPDANGDHHLFEESFSRITRVGDPARWVVTTTEGRTMTFGDSPATRVPGPGGTAAWLLSTVTDPFGNSVAFEYDPGPIGDTGGRYPARIRYAEGTREVRFVLEGRPDPRVDFAGGLPRRRSQRLREVQVFVNDQLHHRMALRYETSLSTNLSRLVSIQRFGSDCDPVLVPDPVAGGGCTSLPPAEFSYTDAGRISAAERWQGMGLPDPSTRPWYAPPTARFTPDNVLVQGANTQFADIDGDGLPDIIVDLAGRDDAPTLMPVQPSFASDGQGSPFIYLNDGVEGWQEPTWNGGLAVPPETNATPDNDSAVWTDRIRALRFDLASQRVKQTASAYLDSSPGPFTVGVESGAYPSPVFGTCIESGDALPGPVFVPDGGSIQLSGPEAFGSAPYFDATAGRNWPTGVPGVPAPVAEWDEIAESEIRPWPHFQIVDLDADGRADLVMSIRLSGYHLSLEGCETPAMQPFGQAIWIEGATTRVVFMNTGEGWERDDGRDAADGNYADTLPLFGVVAFEASDLAHREIGRLQPDGGFWDREDEQLASPCDDYGLAGMREPHSWQVSVSYDFCVAVFDLTPVFEDFDGDGFPDLMVTGTSDPDALFHNHASQQYDDGPLQFRASSIESQVWLQNPQATGSEARWVRAPAYDPPYRHSFVMQISGDSSAPPLATGYLGAVGKPQLYNIDKGVRLADLNRDGLSDMLFSPGGASLGEFDDQGGVLLNRGAAHPTAARYSAWCSSSPIPNVETCAEAAGPYRSPFQFAWFDPASHWYSGPLLGSNQQTLVPHQIGFDLVDLNGDGYLDILRSPLDPGDGYGPSGAYLQQPGRAGSVWVEHPDFRPPEHAVYQDQPPTSTALANRSGYAVTDVNGDGVADLIGSEPAMSHKQSWVSTPEAAHGDLLASYSDGLGRRVELEYQSARGQRDPAREARALAQALAPLHDADLENDDLFEPLGPDPVWPSVDDVVDWPKGAVLVARRVTAPGQAETETHYRYAHPRRCLDHRERLGFRFVEEIRGDGTRIERFYHQKHGRTGRLAERIVRDAAGRPLHFVREEWALPSPASVVGGWAAQDGRRFDTAYIGRLRSRRSRNEYGETLGERPGFETGLRMTYDDAHGYNFVSEEFRDIPGRSLRIDREPHAIDGVHRLLRRPARVTVWANEAGDGRKLAESLFDYRGFDGAESFGRVGRQQDLVTAREGSSESRWRIADSTFDAYGNLVEQRLSDSAEGPDSERITRFCFDGDADCPVGQGSHSIASGVRDANGRWTYSEPHPIFAAVVRSRSEYMDVPTMAADYDALGRQVRVWHEGRGGAQPVLLSQTTYQDSPSGGAPHAGGFTPFVVERRYASTDPESGVESIGVGGAHGTSWLSIEVVRGRPGGEATLSAVATRAESDPDARLDWTTEPFACDASPLEEAADPVAIVSACLASQGALSSRRERRFDELGRLVRIHTPLGFELFDYDAEAYSPGSGVPALSHDRVWHKNANGGLRQTLLAGGQPVAIRECNNAELDPDLASFTGLSCEAPDTTRLVYEPTGELRERVDATVPLSGGAGAYAFGAFANQKLALRYDTLGQVIELDDPDAGVTRNRVDAFGQRVSSVDAREIEVRRSYDRLGRPTRIESDGETPTEFVYAPRLLRQSRVRDGSVEKWFVYDAMGRIWKSGTQVAGRSLPVETRYDFLNRPVEIRYPTVLNGAVDTIAYDYAGGFLERVCDVGVEGGDCDSPEATAILSSVEYDDLGRVVEMVLPGGVRRFEYDGRSERRTADRFASHVSGSDHDVDFRYVLPAAGAGAEPAPAYDALGNLLRVDATIAATPFELEYAFDARNRIDAWAFDGDPREYAYDARGNLVQNDDEIQIFASGQTAHAIRWRLAATGSHAYHYDAAGNLERESSPSFGTRHFRFDARGRLACIGSGTGSDDEACSMLRVSYNGLGERVEQRGSETYLYSGADFRLRPLSDGGQEYWIEIHALGQRIAYKHVVGGAIRLVGSGPSVGWPLALPEDTAEGLALAVRAIALWAAVLLVWSLVVLVCTAPAPFRAAFGVLACLGMSLWPVRVWAAAGFSNPEGLGTAVYRWVLSDRIGSSLVEIDRAGFVLGHALHGPFGRILEPFGGGGSGGGAIGGVGGRNYYAGHDRENDSGLVYMHARWMDPRSGTFLSVDPVVRSLLTPQSFNGYAYAENNPISGIDPTGEFLQLFTITTTDAEGVPIGAPQYQVVEMPGAAPSGGDGGAGGGSGSSAGGGAGAGAGAGIGGLSGAGGGGSAGRPVSAAGGLSSAPTPSPSAREAGNPFSGVEEFEAVIGQIREVRQSLAETNRLHQIELDRSIRLLAQAEFLERLANMFGMLNQSTLPNGGMPQWNVYPVTGLFTPNASEEARRHHARSRAVIARRDRAIGSLSRLESRLTFRFLTGMDCPTCD